MTVWPIGAGWHGENERTALDQGIAAIGWIDMPDMGPAQDRPGWSVGNKPPLAPERARKR